MNAAGVCIQGLVKEPGDGVGELADQRCAAREAGAVGEASFPVQCSGFVHGTGEGGEALRDTVFWILLLGSP